MDAKLQNSEIRNIYNYMGRDVTKGTLCRENQNFSIVYHVLEDIPLVILVQKFCI